MSGAQARAGLDVGVCGAARRSRARRRPAPRSQARPCPARPHQGIRSDWDIVNWACNCMLCDAPFTKRDANQGWAGCVVRVAARQSRARRRPLLRRRRCPLLRRRTRAVSSMLWAHGHAEAHGYACTGMHDCYTHITALYAHAPAHKQSWAPKPHHSWSHLRHGRAGTVPMLVHSCAGTEAHLRCD